MLFAVRVCACEREEVMMMDEERVAFQEEEKGAGTRVLEGDLKCSFARIRLGG